jgi:hypothetical protein
MFDAISGTCPTLAGLFYRQGPTYVEAASRSIRDTCTAIILSSWAGTTQITTWESTAAYPPKLIAPGRIGDRIERLLP